ncbi:hypothetical protein GE061_002026 [Apolygus lucorum]|uniref:Uncharacterized protein n=1 Tax=Apolygus lucorum TaxID=248454 RepID=A0A6A4JD06_APOLU|nr:hypothetical protein GE061_002026 [Apolygus lucorum]
MAVSLRDHEDCCFNRASSPVHVAIGAGRNRVTNEDQQSTHSSTYTTEGTQVPGCGLSLYGGDGVRKEDEVGPHGGSQELVGEAQTIGRSPLGGASGRTHCGPVLPSYHDPSSRTHLLHLIHF